MATTTNEEPFEIDDLSGGIQRKTTKFQSKPNEVDIAINASFGRLGGIEKIKGADQVGNAITTTTTTSTSTSSSTSTSTSTSSTTTAP